MTIRRDLVFAFVILPSVSMTACAAEDRAPTITVHERFRPYAHGRVLYENAGILLVSSILAECRIRAYKNSHADASRIAEKSQPLGFTILGPSALAAWSSDLKREFVVVPATTRFRVVGAVTYRCSLPSMTIASADDEGLNQNDMGHDGEYYRIRLLEGPHRGALLLWNPDFATVTADTKKPCLPGIVGRNCSLGS